MGLQEPAAREAGPATSQGRHGEHGTRGDLGDPGNIWMWEAKRGWYVWRVLHDLLFYLISN